MRLKEQKVEYTATYLKGEEEANRSPTTSQSTCTTQGRASENFVYDKISSKSTRMDTGSDKEEAWFPEKVLEAIRIKDKKGKHGGEVKQRQQ